MKLYIFVWIEFLVFMSIAEIGLLWDGGCVASAVF